MHARRSGPAPQRPARRPRHRPARRDATTQAYWRQGVHRTGNDHPEKKTPTPISSPRRQDLQQNHQPGPLQDRESHRQHQNMESPTHRPQKTTTNLPRNHHSHPRNHIHLHPMNKPPWLPFSEGCARDPDPRTGSGDVFLIQGNLTGADVNKTLLGDFSPAIKDRVRSPLWRNLEDLVVASRSLLVVGPHRFP